MAVGSDVQIWATAISTNVNNGRKIIFRFAKEFRLDFNRASQPVRIIFVWKYEAESGQPGPGEHQRMNLFEDTLESVLKEDGFATLALVSTGEGLREWIYYTTSEPEFVARFDYALAGMPTYPIEIHTAWDPNWETWERFKAGLKPENP